MVRLEFAESGDFYQVVTAGPVRKTQYKNKVPLWEGAHSTLPREGNPLVAHRASQRGQSGENSIASDIDKGKSFLAADGAVCIRQRCTNKRPSEIRPRQSGAGHS